MAFWIGQDFKVTFEITPEKGADAKSYEFSLKLPYSWDGVVMNIPGLLAGLPESAWQSEFVSLAVETSAEDEEINTDEFSLGDI